MHVIEFLAHERTSAKFELAAVVEVPLVVPLAPGNVAKRLSKLRFS